MDIANFSAQAGAAKAKFTDMGAVAENIWNQTRTPMERYEARLSQLNGLLRRGQLDQDTYARAVARAREGIQAQVNEVSRLNSAVGSLSNSILGFSTAAGAANVAANLVTDGIRSAAQAVIHTAANAVKLAADFEQTAVAFTTMLGSAAAAESVLSSLSRFAAETPFEFPELATAARKLTAFGVGADQIVPTLRVLGDVSAGISQPIGEIAEIYGKARVQGRLFAEDINQLTGRGIPIMASLAEQFGVTESQVRKLVESGKVGFDNLQVAMVSLTEEGGTFHDMMKAQSQTLSGLGSTLKDNVNLALRDFGTALTESAHLKERTQDLIDFTAKLREATPELARMTAKYAELSQAAFNAGTFGVFSGEDSEQTKRGEDLDAQIAALNKKLAEQGLDRGQNEGFAVETREDATAAEALAKLNAKLREEMELYGLTGTAREIAALRLKGLNEAQLEEATALLNVKNTMDAVTRAQEEADNAQRKLYADVDSLTASLQEQIDTWGMSADAIKLHELAARGATEADLAAAKALAEKLDALREQKKAADEAAAAQKKLADEGKRLFEQTRTPAEKLEAQYQHLSELRDKGLIDEETLDRALDQADDRFHTATNPNHKKASHAHAHGDHNNAALEQGTAAAFHASFGGKSDSQTFQQMLKNLMKSQRDTERIRLLQEKNNVKPAAFGFGGGGGGF